MPTPLTPLVPLTGKGIETRTYHLTQPQGYAVAQERKRHDEALYAMGEYAAFVLLWNAQDHQRGLVGYCPTCYLSRDTAKHFHQPSKNRCPDCLGTTFEGGYRALIIRHALFSDTVEDTRAGKRGEVERQGTTVQSTSDFRMRSGDLVLRADASRWRLTGGGQSAAFQTGFGHIGHPEGSAGYNYGQVVKEEETSVAFEIPFDPTLLAVDSHVPVDMTPFETVRGPLLP